MTEDPIREALAELLLMARTSGGTDGPDALLMVACDKAEAALSAQPAEPVYLPLSATKALMLFNSCGKTTESWSDQLVAFARAIERAVRSKT